MERTTRVSSRFRPKLLGIFVGHLAISPEESWDSRLLAGYSPGEALWMRGFYGLTIRKLTCLERNMSQSSRIFAKFEWQEWNAEMPNIPRWQDTRPSYGLIDASVYGACSNLGSPKTHQLLQLLSGTTSNPPFFCGWFIFIPGPRADKFCGGAPCVYCVYSLCYSYVFTTRPKNLSAATYTY